MLQLKSMNNDHKESFINDYKFEKKETHIQKKNIFLENSLNLSGLEKINNQSKVEILPFNNIYHKMNNNKIHTKKKKKKILIE
jgi:hypothetical protein